MDLVIEVFPPGQQGPPVLVQRIILASTTPRGFPLESLLAASELVLCQMHDVERIHHFRRLGQYLVDGGGGHAHPIDGQLLEDSAGHPVGELGPVIGAVEGGLEVFPPTLLIGADGSVVILILYRPGPLHVGPPRTVLCGQLRTPKREETVNNTR